MSKSRFSTPDVLVMVRDLRSSILGQKVSNIYDINDKSYLFKFASPGSTEKIILLMESGVRFHTTKYSLAKNETPSPFAMKLRKFIRSKRIDDIRQLSFDRVVDFKFGSGETANHIILELYSQGNIVLTDSNYEIIALLRSHLFEDDVALKAGEIYPLQFTTVGSSLGNSDNSSSSSIESSGILNMDLSLFLDWARQKDNLKLEAAVDESQATGKKNKARKSNLRLMLMNKDSGIASYGGEIVDHCVLSAGLSPTMKLEQLLTVTVEQFEAMKTHLRDGRRLFDSLNVPGQFGYILWKQPKQIIPAAPVSTPVVEEPNAVVSTAVGVGMKGDDKEYIEFVPIILKQHEGTQFIEFPSFDEAVDEYFSKIEDQRLQRKAKSAEETAARKVEKVKSEQQNQIDKLVQQQARMEAAATLVEVYAKDIEKVCLVINSALGSGMDWAAIELMVRSEAAAGNPIAALVHKLRLDRNHVVLRLKDPFAQDSDDDDDNDNDDDDSDEETPSKLSHQQSKLKRQENKKKPANAAPAFIEAEIDLALSAYANARNMFGNKKVAHSKELKTIESSAKVIQSVEQQALKSINAQKIARNLRAVRKVHWFEKFHWFISSEGYLVLSGHDAQQNEMLVKKYLRAEDIYVHANLSGAATCIVRNKSPSNVVSPIALHEAATAAVCRSIAWTNKVMTSAWWVYANQVSKTAPSGEYLTTGSFLIYGKKNFLPPSTLEMGFAVMFRVTDECTHKHLGERRDRVTVDADGLESVFSEAFDRYGLDYSESTTGVDDSASGDTTEVIVSAVGGSKKPSKAAFKAAGTAKAPTMAPVAEDNDREFNEIADADDDGKSDDDEIIEENENDDDTRETVKNSESNIKASTGKGKSIKAIPPAVPEQKITKRKATLNKKKQRRYAEQDDEDRMIAMLSLGALPDNARSAREKESEDTLTKKKQVLQQKQQRVGVRIGASNATSSVLEQLATTSASVRTKIESLIEAGIVKPTELDSYELEALIALSEADSLAVLSLFEEGLTQRKVGNKSGFLAGILKRYQREKKELPVPSTDSVSRDAPNTIKNSSHVSADGVDNEKENEEAVDTGNLVTHESTTIENGHDHGHSDDEDEDDDGDGDVDKLEAIDELDKITGCPFPDDELLYAIPVCGPYSSLMRYKFRVKLTPGTAKKGKCCKQAVEVFLSGRDASVDEKYLIKGLTDPEMVAIMIGDVKLSTPGLQVVKQQASRKQRGAKKKDK